MQRITFALPLALCALLAPALSHAEVSCTRAGLQEAVDLIGVEPPAVDLALEGDHVLEREQLRAGTRRGGGLLVRPWR